MYTSRLCAGSACRASSPAWTPWSVAFDSVDRIERVGICLGGSVGYCKQYIRNYGISLLSGVHMQLHN